MPNSITLTKVIELQTSTISYRTDGIMQITIKPNQSISKENAQEMVEIMGTIGKGKKSPVLIVADEYSLPEAEARPYIASTDANRYTLANAFVIKSLAQKLLANVYLKIDKPVMPTKFFSNEKEAVKWLKQFLK